MLKETNKTGQVEEDSLHMYLFRHIHNKKAALNGCIVSERTEEQHSTGGTLALLIQNAISLWLDNILSATSRI